MSKILKNDWFIFIVIIVALVICYCKLYTAICKRENAYRQPHLCYQSTTLTNTPEGAIELIPIIDTDGMKHYVYTRTHGFGDSAYVTDTAGHSLVFHKGEFYHGKDKTHCRKCIEIERSLK